MDGLGVSPPSGVFCLPKREEAPAFSPPPPPGTPPRVRLSWMPFSELYYLHDFLLANFLFNHFQRSFAVPALCFPPSIFSRLLILVPIKIFHRPDANIFICINASQYQQAELVTRLFMVFLGEYMLHRWSKAILAGLNSSQLHH